jgi:S-methylmethionine-dependent homocysteine/selenocysteine methylase
LVGRFYHARARYDSGVILLDGPIGTELDARGVDTSLPLWSARALMEAPEVVRAIHRDYAEAGATVHTANTFRTRERTVGADWERLARRAVALAREAVPADHEVAGSLAPLEDCYQPDRSPPAPRDEHRALAEVLADAGCDRILCETFPHVGEAVIAVEEALRTGLPAWVALTAGPSADLLSPEEIAEGGRRAVDAGASAVLVNCVPAVDTLRFVEALAAAELGVPIGAYANAGSVDDRIGWRSDAEMGPARYASLAVTWWEAGATILGSCCGTGPAHIRALAGAVGRSGAS